MSKKSAEDLKNIFMQVCMEYIPKYGHRFVSGNECDKATQIKEYIDTFVKSGIDSKNIISISNQLMKSGLYSEYPPKPGDFVLAWENQQIKNKYNEKGGADIYNSFLSFDRVMSARYKALWSSLNSTTREDFVTEWIKELSELKVGSKEIAQLADSVKLASVFSRYPPKSVDLCIILAAKTGLPTPSEAYVQACMRKSDIHCTVRYAKKMTGSYNLRSRNDYSIREVFSSHYVSGLRKFFSGSISELDSKAAGILIDPVATKKSAKKELSRIIASF